MIVNLLTVVSPESRRDRHGKRDRGGQTEEDGLRQIDRGER